MIAFATAACARDRHTAGVVDYADDGRRTPSRWGYGTERLPTALDELAGSESGNIELPLHLAWSGLRVFALGDVKLRIGLYRIVLNNGSRDDFVRYLNRGHLVRHWPVLRKMLGRGVRAPREEAFPELRQLRAGH